MQVVRIIQGDHQGRGDLGGRVGSRPPNHDIKWADNVFCPPNIFGYTLYNYVYSFSHYMYFPYSHKSWQRVTLASQLFQLRHAAACGGRQLATRNEMGFSGSRQLCLAVLVSYFKAQQSRSVETWNPVSVACSADYDRRVSIRTINQLDSTRTVRVRTANSHHQRHQNSTSGFHSLVLFLLATRPRNLRKFLSVPLL